MDELLQNHRTELRLLQNEIQKLKKSVPKGDKKRVKEIQLIIYNLEKNLSERHNKEIECANLSNCVTTISVDCNDDNKPIKKKRRNKIKLYDEIIRRHEENECSTDGYKELESIKAKLSNRNLVFIDIPADGNCLFNAIGYQCVIHKILNFSVDFNKSDELPLYLRELVYKELMAKKDFYSAFFSSEDSSEFNTYCEEMRSTRAWGGQMEINALSEVLECSIEIIQAHVPSIIVGENNYKHSLIITYHRFAYGLGEHYNTCDIKNVE